MRRYNDTDQYDLFLASSQNLSESDKSRILYEDSKNSCRKNHKKLPRGINNSINYND